MELKIDHSSPVPLHFQVEELLRQMLEMPEYQNGGFLPKEVELAKRLGISRNTIRQATNKLEYEGLLIRKKGVGTKVSEKTVTTNLDSWHSFTQEMSEKGIEFVNFLIETRWEKADEKIAGFMKIAQGTEILCLARLRGFADGPFVYFESYFHPHSGQKCIGPNSQTTENQIRRTGSGARALCFRSGRPTHRVQYRILHC